MSWLRWFSPTNKEPEVLPPAIRFGEAVLCEDCRRVTASKNSTCTSCGSAAIWSLSRVLEVSSIDAEVEKILNL